MKFYPRPLFTVFIFLFFYLSSVGQDKPEVAHLPFPYSGHSDHIGGAVEEDEETGTLYSEKSKDLGLWTIADSVANIPAFDTYCHWDTRNLFHVKSARENIGKGQYFVLGYNDCDFFYPVQGQITSPFGPRWGRMHYGLDIDLETGDPVAAAFEGMVRISQYHSSYGNVVVVRHNNGLETVYAHMSQREVAPGDYVQAGDVIGLGGNTGRSFGSHLHFEIRYLGDAIDPNVIVDPVNRSLRDREVVITDKHFEYYANLATVSKAGAKYHLVRRGETLSAIARKRGVSVKSLCKLNRIKETSIIRAGQKLRYR